MKFKDWLYVLLGGSVAIAAYLFAKFVYKKLKAGKWDWWLSEKEKEELLQTAEKIVREYEEEREK